MKKTILGIVLMGILLSAITSCKNDDFGPSIINTDDDLDPTSESYEFDLWLRSAYLKPYNLEFRYKMQDNSSDMAYNLVPAYFDKSQEMALLIKYLWFDAYNAIAGENFLKENGPKIIQIIGSGAYNTASKTKVMGTAEGGLVVTLYDCNAVDRNNVSQLNTYYFNTMHHEFAHILHQKKTYPIIFDDISKGKYAPIGWQERTMKEAAQLGFVSPYASSQPREDFVETISNYLTKTDSEWNAILEAAKSPANTNNDNDYIDGRYYIKLKLNICATWLEEAWKINIHNLRTEIQRRQTTIEEIFTK